MKERRTTDVPEAVVDVPIVVDVSTKSNRPSHSRAESQFYYSISTFRPPVQFSRAEIFSRFVRS